MCWGDQLYCAFNNISTQDRNFPPARRNSPRVSRLEENTYFRIKYVQLSLLICNWYPNLKYLLKKKKEIIKEFFHICHSFTLYPSSLLSNKHDSWRRFNKATATCMNCNAYKERKYDCKFTLTILWCLWKTMEESGRVAQTMPLSSNVGSRSFIRSGL